MGTGVDSVWPSRSAGGECEDGHRCNVAGGREHGQRATAGGHARRLPARARRRLPRGATVQQVPNGDAWLHGPGRRDQRPVVRRTGEGGEDALQAVAFIEAGKAATRGRVPHDGLVRTPTAVSLRPSRLNARSPGAGSPSPGNRADLLAGRPVAPAGSFRRPRPRLPGDCRRGPGQAEGLGERGDFREGPLAQFPPVEGPPDVPRDEARSPLQRTRAMEEGWPSRTSRTFTPDARVDHGEESVVGPQSQEPAVRTERTARTGERKVGLHSQAILLLSRSQKQDRSLAGVGGAARAGDLASGRIHGDSARQGQRQFHVGSTCDGPSPPRRPAISPRTERPAVSRRR